MREPKIIKELPWLVATLKKKKKNVLQELYKLTQSGSTAIKRNSQS